VILQGFVFRVGLGDLPRASNGGAPAGRQRHYGVVEIRAKGTFIDAQGKLALQAPRSPLSKPSEKTIPVRAAW